MFRYVWPSSGVKPLVVRKMLCSFGLSLVRSHVCTGVSLRDGFTVHCWAFATFQFLAPVHSGYDSLDAGSVGGARTHYPSV
jgi:hypothetical protein